MIADYKQLFMLARYRALLLQVPTMRTNLQKISLFAAAVMVGAVNAISHAQVPQPQGAQQSTVVADIQTSIANSIGAEIDTVEVAVIENVLVVARVNSKMNNATHGDRDNEAMGIAGVVSKAIVGKPVFNAVVNLRVQYVVRQRSSVKDGTVIDTIEFRVDPNDKFKFRKT